LGGDALKNDPKLVQQYGKAAVVQAVLTIFHRTDKKLKCIINPVEYRLLLYIFRNNLLSVLIKQFGEPGKCLIRIIYMF